MNGQCFASSPSGASPSTFAGALDDLKARGCLLLVVGPVGDDAKYVSCRRLLGDELSKARRRLFVTTDDDVTRHPGAVATCGHGEATDTRAIRYETAARSVTAGETPSPTQIDTTVIDGDLEALATATDAAIQEFEAHADDLDTGELRVCIDDLDSIIANDDDVDVVEFVRTLRHRVLATRGMCHVHISRSVPGAPVDAILRYFDALVEVDSSDDNRQRWHVRDAGISTDWLEL